MKGIAIRWFHFITMYMNYLCKNTPSQGKKWISPSFMHDKPQVAEREMWKGDAAAAAEFLKRRGWLQWGAK